MAALWFRLRVELRSPRRLAVIGLLAALVGATGGAVLTAAAGARRTDTAYERMLDATNAPDVVVRPSAAAREAVDPAELGSLPQVSQAGEVRRFYIAFGRRGPVSERPSIFGSASVDGHAFYDIGRPKVLEGRLPDPKRPNEVMISRVLRRDLGVEVGDRLPAVVVAFESESETGLRNERVELRVVGRGVSADEIGVDRITGFQLLLTPAFYEREHSFSIEWNEMIRLRPGADLAEFTRGVRALAGGRAIDVASQADDVARVERAVQPSVIALWLFAVVLAVASLLVLSQTIARQLFLDAVDDATLGALGLTRTERFVLGLLRVLPVAVVGAVLAVAVAIVASPLMPIGPARVAEPDPGVLVDALLLALGCLAIVAGLLGAAALPSWRIARRQAVEGGARMSADPGRSRVAERLAELGAPPPAVAGTRFALESGAGAKAVPARATLAGVAAAVAAVLASLTFAAGLDHLVSTPRLWGTTWDITISTAVQQAELTLFDTPTSTEADLLEAKQTFIEQQLGDDDDVTSWSVAAANTVTLDGSQLPALGVGREGGVAPVVASGRLPRTDHEVALGSTTLERLGVDLGDHVRDDAGRRVRVVGVAVLPRFATIGGADEAALGRGAVFTLQGVLERSPDFFSRDYLVELEPGADVDDAIARLTEAIAPPFQYFVGTALPPDDILNYRRVDATPVVLAGILAVLGVATLAHALVTSVRRRRRDLALLATLGFARRQTAATVAWQATTVAAVAVLVGVPLGLITGRFASRVLADQIGSLPEPIVPWIAVVVVVLAVLVVANLVAALPARAAARTRPAAVLRSE